MYHFQSKFRSHDVDLGGGKIARFWNYILDTEDEELAKKLRKSKSRDIWEVTPADLTVTDGPKETPIQKRRGRPPKAVTIITGMRDSRVAETQGEGA